MPKSEEAARGGVMRYRTITTGRGKSRRYIHVAVVRKRGKRGGRTVAGPVRHYAKG
jgi:hypothetical protein